MTGIITSTPAPIQPPAGTTTGNPEVLGPLAYVPAVPNLPQNWIAVQTFAPGTIVLQGTGGTGQYVKQTTLNGPLTVGAIPASDIGSGTALTGVNDTNVTLTLGGSPTTALLAATSITLGWSGTLGLSRGGTNADLSATGGAGQYLKQAGVGAAITVGTIPASDIASGAALTRTNDTNITLTLGGTPATAMLAATSLTLGWTGTLAASRGGFGVDVSASAGVPLFAAGVPTFTGTSGSGNFARVTSPTFVTPLLGTPTSGVLTNCTGLPLTGLANQAAFTLLGNNTSGSAAPTAFTIDGLTLKATPAAGDEALIWDVAGAAWKKATISGIGASAGVASLNTKTGALSLSVVKQVFTTSGTYTPTSGMVACIVEGVGAGGGGGATTGSAAPNQFGGGGGQSGSYARSWITAATIGASKAVTIGAHGTGGAAGNNNGSAGGDTSLGTLVIAKGGAGGGFSNNVTVGRGGWSTTASTGDFVEVGAPGTAGLYATVSSVTIEMGQGASSAFGGGAGAANHLSSNPGNAAVGFGGGGSGGISILAVNKAGGDGFDGVLIITEFVIA